MIFTGIVEDNTDPRHFNRVKVRLFGVHTDQDAGQPQIPTDDLPWATPLIYNQIPPLGSKVNVLKDDETYYYFCPFPTVHMNDSDYQKMLRKQMLIDIFRQNGIDIAEIVDATGLTFEQINSL